MARNKGNLMKEITVLNELKTLSKTKADQIEAAYDMVMSQEISKPLCKKAKRLRLDIAKVRIAADKVRESEKKQYTVGANAIQGMYNILKFGTSEKEDKLKNIETHYEQIEAERKKQCEEDRQAELSPYVETVGIQGNLSDKSDQEWKEYLEQVKTWDKERLDKIESARLTREKQEKKEAEEREERIREDERAKIQEENNVKTSVIMPSQKLKEIKARKAKVFHDITTIVYAHTSKDSMAEEGELLGFKGDELRMFSHALSEIKIEISVDKMGIVTILKVDGRELI